MHLSVIMCLFSTFEVFFLHWQIKAQQNSKCVNIELPPDSCFIKIPLKANIKTINIHFELIVLII